MDMQDLKNKIAVISGAGSGFGKATAALFCEQGARVVGIGRSEHNLLKAKEEIGEIDCLGADVTKPDDWQRIYDHVVSKYGRIDILVNNAGGAIELKETTEQSIETIDQIIALNLNSVVYGSRIFAGLMKKQESGTIINISSACATEAWSNFSVYSAAKAGVVVFSKVLYVELRPFNIRVTTVIPGAGRTNFSKNAGIPEPETPFSLEPTDMAEVIRHICCMPQHIEVEEYRFWGTDQEVEPL
jgi:NADP-dependent 3-hydroxy acid dehydrogenase YdfG